VTESFSQEKKEKLYFIKIKNVYSPKDHEKKMKRQDVAWEKIMEKQIFNKGFMSR
jgi:hypothetical protein